MATWMGSDQNWLNDEAASIRRWQSTVIMLVTSPDPSPSVPTSAARHCSTCSRPQGLVSAQNSRYQEKQVGRVSFEVKMWVQPQPEPRPSWRGPGPPARFTWA
jgi:ribosomal protein S14